MKWSSHCGTDYFRSVELKKALSRHTRYQLSLKTLPNSKNFWLDFSTKAGLNVLPVYELRSLWLQREPRAMIQNYMNFQLQFTQGHGVFSRKLGFPIFFFFFFSFATEFIILQRMGLSSLQESIYHCWLSASSPHGRSNWIVFSAHDQDSRETHSCKLENQAV